VASELGELLDLEVLLVSYGKEDFVSNFAHIDSGWVCCIEENKGKNVILPKIK
jgi:hypothetical protein